MQTSFLNKALNFKFKPNVIENIKVLIFSFYCLSYSIYIMGFLNRYINFIFLFLFMLICFIQLIVNKTDLKKVLFKDDVFLYMLAIVFILIYSLGVQIYNNDLKGYLYSQLLYLIAPFLVAILWVWTTPKDYLFVYFYILFARGLIQFSFKFFTEFSIENIKKITWFNSNSSVFETKLAHDFLFYLIIFRSHNNKKLAFLCLLICLLSFKRLSFILSVVFLFIYKFLPKRKVSPILITILVIFFTLVPFIVLWLISDGGQSFFLNTFGMELDKFTTGRVDLIETVLNGMNGHYNGFGSISNFLNKNNSSIDLVSMHCDILMLYLECSIVSVFLYINSILRIGRKNYITLFMALYLILELVISQFLTNMGAWTIFFMFVYYMAVTDQKTNKECMIK